MSSKIIKITNLLNKYFLLQALLSKILNLIKLIIRMFVYLIFI